VAWRAASTIIIIVVFFFFFFSRSFLGRARLLLLDREKTYAT